jgi:hypothetical protein
MWCSSPRQECPSERRSDTSYISEPYDSPAPYQYDEFRTNDQALGLTADDGDGLPIYPMIGGGAGAVLLIVLVVVCIKKRGAKANMQSEVPTRHTTLQIELSGASAQSDTAEIEAEVPEDEKI